ncbi:hypothetical protein [Acidovorax sp. A1169]|uniref:hypothetical protein n=1 Tax=Acidovorax sp. A1169 TaxID=3059524 RepID=UPI002737B5D4|nr:hypothetical protein [Acidovorax sp. A1169]MDP4073839.1 hypothetical protein [Acidovorax sp. A1169]
MPFEPYSTEVPPTPLERVGYWACLIIIAGIAALFTYGICVSLLDGVAQRWVKGGGGSLVFRAKDPVGFYAAQLPSLLIGGFFWYAVYWVYQTYLSASRTKP